MQLGLLMGIAIVIDPAHKLGYNGDPPTPADARGSAPGHNTFDPFLTSSSSIAENSRSQTIEVKLDVKLWLSSRISEGTFRPPGSLLLPARN